uniref:ATP synthase F0 subunit 8 n=1 Tax=Longipodacrangonyx sp. 1 MDMBR-2012 TaxID=1200665 RepID=K7ZW51_9CRUS|nr:ATP synthase F0 subunit 8 [Longipodacrangonyx sp. 1 MDMBR-2012]
MPQMAPSLWMFIYFFMCFMIILLGNYLFFLSTPKLTGVNFYKVNKSFSFMWL